MFYFYMRLTYFSIKNIGTKSSSPMYVSMFVYHLVRRLFSYHINVWFSTDSGSAHNSPINSAATSSNRIGQHSNHKELPGILFCFIF